MSNLRNRMGAVLLLALGALLMAFPAFASTPAGVTAANTAVSDAASQATSIITTNIPVVLGVAVLFVALSVGKRLIRSARG